MDTMKMISNAGLRSRLKQTLVLLLIILVGIIISHAVGAQDFHRSKSKHFKSRYRTQIKLTAHACSIVEKSRTKEPAKPFFAFLKGKPKYQPQAEIDAPTWANHPNAKGIKKEETLVARQ